MSWVRSQVDGTAARETGDFSSLRSRGYTTLESVGPRVWRTCSSFMAAVGFDRRDREVRRGDYPCFVWLAHLFVLSFAGVSSLQWPL
jgi:hypothetical protein